MQVSVGVRDGALIRGYRKACNLTQADVARMARVTASKVSRVERGEECDRAAYLAVAKALGISPKQLWCYRG